MKLMADEKVLLELTPAPRLLGYWVLTRCLPSSIAAAVAVCGAAFVIVSSGRPRPSFSPALLLSGVLAGLLVLAASGFYAACLRRTYRYYVTDKRCAFSGGILLRIRHSVPYHKVTDIEQRQGIVQRLFGIWQVGIYTPGTSSSTARGTAGRPEIAFQGLTDPDEATEAIAEVLSRLKTTGE
jgi:uncharacterized membrane protein YdbT with pleckstrin-like domain